MDDKEIAQKCQQGQTEEFGKLYDRYIKKIYNFIFFKTFHKEIAQDLTSQTFFKALEKIDTFDATKGEFSSWLFRIAQNLVIDNFRREKPQIDISEMFSLAGKESISQQTDNAQLLEKIENYLKTLEKHQREIVIMRVWDGLSYGQISEILGRTEASCKMMFSRTMSKLREDLAPLFIAVLFLIFNLI